MTTGLREARIDLEAIARNVGVLRDRVATPHAMAVVKADGYGHGAVRSARAALDGGADWLGVADLAEAIELRDAGIDAPILAWLHDPSADFTEAVERSIDIGVSTLDQLETLGALSAEATPVVQLKVETGLNRNGFDAVDWERAFSLAAEVERAGRIRVRGIFSHLSNASPADDAAAIAAYERALGLASEAGLRPELRHLASTAAALRRPEARYDLVRLGIGMYGLSPFGADETLEVPLSPAMTLRSRVAATRPAGPGEGVSYDLTWRADRATTLALVPLGYADGVPRAASGRGEVAIGGRRFPVRGRIAMDQFVVDVGDHGAAVGEEVVVFGDPAAGHPSADDWARWSDTINYEIVTRIGPRVRRVP